MRATIRGFLFALLCQLLVRRGMTPDQAQTAAQQMTETPIRALWEAR